jgi:NAD(P)-dependent dehydrogenase (short-subunit alcohol dehydrogenase family)
MEKRILITGAGSGFGEGVALGLAQKGHEVIAACHVWPQVTKLTQKAESLGVKNLHVEKLNILDPCDVENALHFDIDILVNNAAIGYAGPIAEIPIELVRRNFETNVFASLNLAQKFIRKYVDEKRSGKIVFVSSIAGLLTAPGFGPYCATKHALESVAEAMHFELKPYNIQIQTINPGAFKTGFNDTMAQTAFHWMDDEKNFTKKSDIEKMFDRLLDNQMDPQEMIEAMINIIPANNGKFRNVVPQSAEIDVKKVQEKAWGNIV